MRKPLFFLQVCNVLFVHTRGNVYKSRHTYVERQNVYVLLMLLESLVTTKFLVNTMYRISKGKNEQKFLYVYPAIKIQKITNL